MPVESSASASYTKSSISSHSETQKETRGQQMFSIRYHRVHIFSFEGHMASITTLPL